MNENTLIQLFGWPATIIHGDPTVFDRWNWIRRHLKKGNLRTLDAGCGSGAFTLYAAKIGNDVLGLSFNDQNNSRASRRAEILRLNNCIFKTLDLRQLDFSVQKLGLFDQILCIETVEHLLEDQKLINNLASLLKPGGKLFLTTPYKGHRPLIGESQDPNYIGTVEDGGHIRFGYTSEELKKLIVTSGLHLEKIEFMSGYVSQKIYTLECTLDQIIPHALSWFVTFPLRLFQLFDRIITGTFRYPYLSIAVIATKPA